MLAVGLLLGPWTAQAGDRLNRHKQAKRTTMATPIAQSASMVIVLPSFRATTHG